MSPYSNERSICISIANLYFQGFRCALKNILGLQQINNFRAQIQALEGIFSSFNLNDKITRDKCTVLQKFGTFDLF